jgi:GAF domain-containing protein
LLLSSAGQAHCRFNPPPGNVSSVGFVIVPMRVAGATLGTLAFLDARGRHVIDESDVEWIQLVADRIALSVEHARLAERSVVHAAEMDMVRTIATANRQGPNIRMALGAIAERVTTMPDVDAADIMLLNAGTSELTVAVSAGYRSTWPAELRVDARWTALNRKSRKPEVEHRSALELHAGHPRRPQFMREGFQTFGSLPIYSQATPIGVLNLYSRRQVDWDENRLEFFDSLAGLVAMAVARPSASPTAAARQTTQPPGFTELETRMLPLIAEGLTNREIAAQIHRSENTVKFHVRRILDKSETANRVQFVRRALVEGWL